MKVTVTVTTTPAELDERGVWWDKARDLLSIDTLNEGQLGNHDTITLTEDQAFELGLLPRLSVLWGSWQTFIAERLEWEAEDLRAGGGSPLFNSEQRDISAQAWSNAARKVAALPMPPLP